MKFIMLMIINIGIGMLSTGITAFFTTDVVTSTATITVAIGSFFVIFGQTALIMKDKIDALKLAKKAKNKVKKMKKAKRK